MGTVRKIVTIEVENDDDDNMAIAAALDLFNDMNTSGTRLTWVDEQEA